MLHFVVAFPTGRDSATFRDKGTEVPSLSRDKGTTGQAQNLAKGRAGTITILLSKPRRDAGRDGTHYLQLGTKKDRANFKSVACL